MSDTTATEIAVDAVEELASESSNLPVIAVAVVAGTALVAAAGFFGYRKYKEMKDAEAELLVEDDDPSADA